MASTSSRLARSAASSSTFVGKLFPVIARLSSTPRRFSDSMLVAHSNDLTEVPVNPLLIAALLVLAVVVPAPAQVRVDIGVNLPGPPSLVVVPGTPVYYAPQAPANVFLYGHQYWAFTNAGWHVGPNWNGPWAVVEPTYVPVPVLRVPVAYYPAPPGHWRGWPRAPAPPSGAPHRPGRPAT